MAGGLNLYGFAGGDPVNFSDPFGLFPCCLINFTPRLIAEPQARRIALHNRAAAQALEPAGFADPVALATGGGFGAVPGKLAGRAFYTAGGTCS